MPATEIDTYAEALDAMNRLRVRSELICIFMLAAVVSTKQGPFAQSKGLDVSCASQGYTIWWLMKNFYSEGNLPRGCDPGA